VLNDCPPLWPINVDKMFAGLPDHPRLRPQHVTHVWAGSGVSAVGTPLSISPIPRCFPTRIASNDNKASCNEIYLYFSKLPPPRCQGQYSLASWTESHSLLLSQFIKSVPNRCHQNLDRTPPKMTQENRPGDKPTMASAWAHTDRFLGQCVLPSFMEARLVWQLEPQVPNFVCARKRELPATVVWSSTVRMVHPWQTIPPRD
jgi:hypothetical protein